MIDDTESRCPRCHYDLSGALAAWEKACPLQGRCPECGLTFRWRDILNAEYRALPWLYEHARTPMSVRALIVTCWRALRPWSFWSRVHVHHPIAPTRLLLWPALCSLSILTLTTTVGYAVIVMDALDSTTNRRPSRYVKSSTDPAALLSPLTVQFDRRGVRTVHWRFPPYVDLSYRSTVGPRRPRLPSTYFAAIAFIGAGALVILLCPSEWKRAHVHPWHLLRLCCYGFAAPIAAQALVSVFLVAGWLMRFWEISGSSVPYRSAGLIPIGLWNAVALEADGWLFYIVLTWLAIFWWFALGAGLQLRRHWRLWSLVSITGVVAATNALAVIDPGVIQEAFMMYRPRL